MSESLLNWKLVDVICMVGCIFHRDQRKQGAVGLRSISSIIKLELSVVCVLVKSYPLTPATAYIYPNVLPSLSVGVPGQDLSRSL